MATEARAEVLRRIRSAIAAPALDASAVAAEWHALPRAYKRTGALDRDAVLELLEDRLRDYDATVVRARPDEVTRTIAMLLEQRGKSRLVVPPGLAAPLPEGFEFLVDEGCTAEALNEFEGVLTASTLAIAQTGTIVLQNVAGQGRRAATLVPDYHLCLVRAADVVETVPEAMARLHATAALATTFVSGPSATADIEMTRIKGVHGPRFLDVVLVL
jgi:L-lactate dehydrogenase complex protein LldG